MKKNKTCAGNRADSDDSGGSADAGLARHSRAVVERTGHQGAGRVFLAVIGLGGLCAAISLYDEAEKAKERAHHGRRA